MLFCEHPRGEKRLIQFGKEWIEETSCPQLKITRYERALIDLFYLFHDFSVMDGGYRCILTADERLECPHQFIQAFEVLRNEANLMRIENTKNDD